MMRLALTSAKLRLASEDASAQKPYEPMFVVMALARSFSIPYRLVRFRSKNIPVRSTRQTSIAAVH